MILVCKEVFLTILRHHVREGHLQYLNQLRADLYAEDNDEIDEAFNSHHSLEAKSAANDSLPCELELRYPLLQSTRPWLGEGTIRPYRREYIVYVSHIVYDIVYDIRNDTTNFRYRIQYCIRYCLRD